MPEELRDVPNSQASAHFGVCSRIGKAVILQAYRMFRQSVTATGTSKALELFSGFEANPEPSTSSNRSSAPVSILNAQQRGTWRFPG